MPTGPAGAIWLEEVAVLMCIAHSRRHSPGFRINVLHICIYVYVHVHDANESGLQGVLQSFTLSHRLISTSIIEGSVFMNFLSNELSSQ